MTKRFPIRTAIAGFTALAVTAPMIAPTSNTVLSAPFAFAAEAVTVVGEKKEILLGESATFTATVPNAEGGNVQFYLDGVALDGPVELTGTTAKKQITPRSYTAGAFKHTVTARYIDKDGYNPSADGVASFTTPIDLLPVDDRRGTDADTYLGSKIGTTKGNLEAVSLDSPAEIQAGSKFWLQAGEESSGAGRWYESGFNPPVGVTYVNGTMERDGGNSQVTTRGNDAGQIEKVIDGRTYEHPFWGTTRTDKYDATYPKVNKEYVGQQPKDNYYTSKGTQYVIRAQFNAPQTPGVYVPQYAVYKYTSAYHALRRMDDAAFLIPAQELPERLIKPETSVTAPEESTTTETTSAAEPTPTTSNESAPVESSTEQSSTEESTSQQQPPVQEATAPTVTVTTLTGEKTTDDEITLTATVDPASEGTVEFFNGDTKIDGTVNYDPATGEATLTTKLPEGDYTVTAKFTPAEGNTTAKEATSDAAPAFTVKKKEEQPEQTTTESTPVESSTEQSSTESTPVESSTEQSTPGEPTPTKTEESTPAESSTEQSTPEESTPAESSTEQSTPEESTPAESSAEQSTPEESTPAESSAEQSTTEQTTPAEPTPTKTEESTPAESSTEQSTPVESSTEQSTPAESSTEQSSTEESTSQQQPPAQEATAPTVTVTAPTGKTTADNITLTATVDPASEGTVEFFNGDTSLGTAKVTNGTATFTTKLAEGTNKIVAKFTPADGNTTAKEATSQITEVNVTKKTDTPAPTLDYTPEVKQETRKITEGATLPAPGDVLANTQDLPAGAVLVWTKLPTQADPYGEITISSPNGAATTAKVAFEVVEKTAETDKSSQSSEGSSLSRPATIGIIITAVAVLLGLLGFGLANNQQFKDFVYNQFGIRL